MNGRPDASSPATPLNTPSATRFARLWNRVQRRALLAAAAVMLSVGLMLLFLLAQAANNLLLYQNYYAPLVVMNALVALMLALGIGWGVSWLWRQWRRGRFGSRLLTKLAAIFALVGVLPGLLIYVVSYQFVSRSIESWFDVKVEGALEAGLNLARTSLDTQARDFGNQLRAAATQLAQTPDGLTALPLERIQEQTGATDISLWGGSPLRMVGSAGGAHFEINPERPAAQQLRTARAQGVATQVEGLDEPGGSARIKALVLVSAPGVSLVDEQRFVQAVQPLPSALVADALAVQEANREYQERALGQGALRRMYIGTLTLSLFLAVFGAVLLAVLLGKQLATPLLMLAKGMRQVAAGDLTPKLVLAGKDELVGLTRSFSDMTQQLADARRAADQHRTRLQTILDNLTAGVIVLDAAGAVQSGNPGADRILGLPLAGYCLGKPLSTLPALQELAQGVQAQFAEFEAARAEHSSLKHWQHTFELHTAEGDVADNAITLVARGALLPGGLRLLVFDDISEVVSAQRARAWGEVARRLAHEIKNPLTPIQLSAERLAHKLAGKLPEAESQMLDKAVTTIVDQVQAMKRLVNEFRDYARLPRADLKPLDLNALITDVLALYESGEGARSVPVRAELDAASPRILGDAQQLRQVIHNLLQNAQDATEAAGRSAPVIIRTQTLQAEDGLHRVRMTIADSGHGFADAILQRAFEPYVTTKAKGTGLGLAVVKKIADEHGARIDLSNRCENGAACGALVSLSFKSDV